MLMMLRLTPSSMRSVGSLKSRKTMLGNSRKLQAILPISMVRKWDKIVLLTCYLDLQQRM